MNGKRTAIVLGAGASRCYEDGTSVMPIQSDILGSFFMDVQISSGNGSPSLGMQEGMRHSYRLGRLLQEKYQIPDDPKNKLGFWRILQEKHSLESIYAELEADPKFVSAGALEDFAAIIRASVRAPTADRSEQHVCRHHRQLAMSLEPGDYIVNFNWDTIMADALLYCSPLWFPATGFGVDVGGCRMNPTQKTYPFPSHVQLLHVHGSLALYEPVEQKSPTALYIGPGQWSTVGALFAATGIDPGDSVEMKNKKFATLTEEQKQRATWDHMFLQKQWFSPVFVPPSTYKKDFNHWYISKIRKSIHSKLPHTQQIVVAGYSFPAADQEHLRRLFVTDVLEKEIQVQVINPSNADVNYRQRVAATFPTAKLNFGTSDFKKFCESSTR